MLTRERPMLELHNVTGNTAVTKVELVLFKKMISLTEIRLRRAESISN